MGEDEFELWSSSGTTTCIDIPEVVGIPKRCWCGEGILTIMSRTDLNPYRRFFRCAFAYRKKLKNDKHVFKWVDEALIDEVRALSIRIDEAEEGVIRGMERQQALVDEMIMESRLDAKLEAKRHLMIVLSVVVVGFLVTLCVMKLMS